MNHGALRPGLVLVTGGAGYIGSVLVGLLLSRGFSVRVLDRLDFGGESLLSYLANPAFELHVGDTGDPKTVTHALTGVTGVVHLAAIVGDPACARDPQSARLSNEVGSAIVCEQAVAASVRRFVFSSTCSNYGKMADPDGFVDESSPLAPVSLYARQKVWFERFLLEHRTEQFVPVCLRFATAFGLSPRMRFDLTVNEFTRDLLMKRRLEVFGPAFWRPYCHTIDLARACLEALTAPDELVAGQTFNVGSNAENYQKLQLVQCIQDSLRDENIATEVALVEKSEDPRDYRVNFARIQSCLGYRTSRSVPDGIREIKRALQQRMFADPYASKHHNVSVGRP